MSDQQVVCWAIDPGHTRLKLAAFSAESSAEGEPLCSGAWSWDALAQQPAPWKTWPEPSNIYTLDRAGARVRLGALEWPCEITCIGPEATAHLQCDYTEGSPGMDRWANMAACHAQSPEGANIIIDAGTCTTIDLRVGSRFLGGAILPGLQMRAQAMASDTDTLPALDFTSAMRPHFPGRSTKESLAAGVVCGAVAECAGLARQLLEKSPDARIIVTGGCAQYFDSVDGLMTFADSLLTLKGVSALAAHLSDASH
jgi:pantothenate kinase type III